MLRTFSHRCYADQSDRFANADMKRRDEGKSVFRNKFPNTLQIDLIHRILLDFFARQVYFRLRNGHQFVFAAHKCFA